jgi:hypothetical protein
MIEINFGGTVAADLVFDYSGPGGYFTFALEIGTWIPPTFNTIDRWESTNIYISQGTNQQRTLTFVVLEREGLNMGDTYDMNWEIGRGSQGGGDWEFIKRLVVDDIIRIAGAEEFANLSATFRKL